MANKFTGFFRAVPVERGQKQEFAIILYTPPEVATAVDDIRRRYDPAYKLNIPPHITVKRPAPLEDGIYLPKLVGLLEEVAQNSKPFEVELNGYSIFHKPDCNVVFLKISDQRPLRELHHKVIEVLKQFYPDGMADTMEGEHYHPHVTIGNKLTDLELSVMEHELQGDSYRLNFKFAIEKMGLLVQEAAPQTTHFTWETLSSFQFGRVSAPK